MPISVAFGFLLSEAVIFDKTFIDNSPKANIYRMMPLSI